MNLFNGPSGARPDTLSIYSKSSFAPNSLLRRYTPSEIVVGKDAILVSESSELGVHLRATAGDGIYGFLAEISTLPGSPPTTSDQIFMKK